MVQGTKRGIISTKSGVDENFFINCDTPESAYLLGFIWGDGYVLKDITKSIFKLSIECVEEDLKLIEKIFNKAGKWTRATRTRKGRKPSLLLTVSNKKLIEYLESKNYLIKSGANTMNKTQLFLHKWLPRFFYKKFDGGKDSGVTGYFLIEWKKFFSIGILHFRKGSRENYHSHAFNALTWFLKGTVTEDKYGHSPKDFGPSIIPKFTPRTNLHRVISHSDTWALTFRGPWEDIWYEYRSESDKIVYLTHGREEIE